ncbi:MAG: hypothetical protein JW912_04130 [Sedimentisphaerales bacterium]|nr:hypothetical protein [Sedimentisphaerales bacterium]
MGLAKFDKLTDEVQMELLDDKFKAGELLNPDKALLLISVRDNIREWLGNSFMTVMPQSYLKCTAFGYYS